MNIEKLIIAILQTSSNQREQSIRNLSQSIMNQITELDKIEKDKKYKNEKQLFQGFFKVIEKVAKQVQEMKQKYESIDKEKLRQKKCITMAKDINFFKEQCFYLRKKLTETRKQLQKITMENELLQSEQEMLQKVYVQRSKQKDQIKYKTLSRFWFRDKQKTTEPRRKTFTYSFSSVSSKNKVDSGQKIEYLSTSQQQRTRNRSMDLNSAFSRKSHKNPSKLILSQIMRHN